MRLLWLVPYGLIFIVVDALELSENSEILLLLCLLTVFWSVLFIRLNSVKRLSEYGLRLMHSRDFAHWPLFLPLLSLPIANIVQFGVSLCAFPHALYISYLAFGEEFFFRGFSAHVLRERFGTLKAALLASLLFALMHCFNPDAVWFELICVFSVGFALTAVRFLTGSLIIPLIIHIAVNLSAASGPIPQNPTFYLILSCIYILFGILILGKSRLKETHNKE